ncbi:UDP-N-acetylmuramate--L-alanine ligase [Candidatus Bealeia paramacronuclearis]|uniref:UDP-N-acetylmuramate--L-alanine ligase n=1 Tax=Candidatus Bealeia paramacronuclearis TaxID=1921001 RepID=A0ABZ2C2I8_9PROT|nr:UDP-N-acetylmuramate--L-alanine ligase [Candidatus Bealeia paramacronuclearis]
MTKIDLSSLKKVHFIGIGGIGMSGLAKVLAESGIKVSGSDVAEGYTLPALRKLGVAVFLTHEAIQIEDADLVVVSTAVKPDNPELLKARETGVQIIHRSEMLAILMQNHTTITISGTHGKTTTTSLMAAVIEGAGLNPTVVNGGIIHAYGTNAKAGMGEWFVAEADESDGSFLNLPSKYVIVTNIDPEHMDYYGTEDRLYQAFTDYINHIPKDGIAVVCGDHPGLQKIIGKCTSRVVTYGEGSSNLYRLQNCRMDGNGATFDVERPCGKMLKDIHLPLLGKHNVLNAMSVIALSSEIGLSDNAIVAPLGDVKGVDRRFTKVGEAGGVIIIDDYAHHPVEIEAVLKSARQVSQGQVIAVFQAHRYSRLNSLFEDFVQALMTADKVIVAPIYSAGEMPIANLCHKAFAEKMMEKGHTAVYSIEDYDELPSLISNISAPQDYVLCLGAGSISKWARMLPQDLEPLFFLHRECA